MLLVAYLASITKGLNTVNDLVDKFNLVNGGNGASQNKPISVSRKGRVSFFLQDAACTKYHLIIAYEYLKTLNKKRSDNGFIINRVKNGIKKRQEGMGVGVCVCVCGKMWVLCLKKIYKCGVGWCLRVFILLR